MMVEADHEDSERPTLLSTPITLILSFSWLITFGFLALFREGPFSLTTLLYGGFVPSQLSHQLGDITPLGLYGGQYWRAVTATFIHFNIIHLILNLIAFFQLGRVVESWYGSLQFLAIYVVLGAGANLLANLLRPWVDGPQALIVHSGGGSTVVLGLIGLVAVVGIRNPSEFPRRAPLWMAAILAANGLLGVVIPNIDNLGHAAGALVGGLLGLLDRRMIRLLRSRWAFVIGTIGAIALIGSVYCQLGHRRDERAAEAQVIQLERRVNDLSRIQRSYRGLAMRGLTPRVAFIPRLPNLSGRPILGVPENPSIAEAIREELRSSIQQLDTHVSENDIGAIAEARQTVKTLAARIRFKPPTPEELATFEQAFLTLFQPTIEALSTARGDLNRLIRPDPKFGAKALNRLAQRARTRLADGEAVPSSPSTPRRTPSSNGSDRETP